MTRSSRGVWVAALAGLWLAGCAETKFAVHTAKQLQPPEARPPVAYKVGDPYQINGVWYYPAEDYDYVESGIASFYGGESQGVNFHGRRTANGEIYDMNALTAAHQTLPMPTQVRVTNLENGRSLVLRVNDRGPFVRGRIIDVSRRAAQLLGFEMQGTARVRVEVMGDESRQMKVALLGGEGPGAARATSTVAAVPRTQVMSDSLPPPRGARAASPVDIAALPPPSATMPPPATSTQPAQRGRAVREQPVARPAAPIIAQPATAEPPRPTVAPPPAPRPGVAMAQAPVRATSLFVQAGTFSNYDAAYRLSARLTRYGSAKVAQVQVGGQSMYRVRVGPVSNVAEADRLLDQVASVVPDAKIVVD